MLTVNRVVARQASSIGHNAHIANALVAIYIACGTGLPMQREQLQVRGHGGFDLRERPQCI